MLLKNLFKLLSVLLTLIPLLVSGQQSFVHPGLWHKQSDIDRMKHMVEAKIDPWYTSFNTLKADAKSSFDYVVRKDPNDNTLSRENPSHQRHEYESDAIAAYQNALMWSISGDSRHADKAVEILNAWSTLVNFYGGGTEPLCAGLYGAPIINAAELIKSTYSGWSASDIQAFKDMLVYPGYSNTTVPQTDINNDNVTFYWRTYMGDPGRHGNQGLLAWRTVMAIGIFLDNEIIYDRALRQIQGLPHRSDDLPYTSGPAITNGVPLSSSNIYYDEFKLEGRASTTQDYGYDDQIQHYIYDNGQCQESSRDQIHSALGLGAIAEMMEVAWNQGDDIYSHLNDRILLGLEFTTKYNLSYAQSYSDQTTPWEPTSFYQILTRTGRWKSLQINPWVGSDLTRNSRGEEGILRPTFEMPVAHFTIREDKSADATWITRARDYAENAIGYEQGNGTDAPGWGGLTYRRPEGCAGDPISGFTGSVPQFSINELPGTIEAENYDFFSGTAEGRTYHDTSSGNSGNAYRTDDNVDVKVCSEGGYNIGDIASGEWLAYTVSVPFDGIFDISIRYASENENGKIKFNFGGADITSDVAVPFGSSNSSGLTDWEDFTVASDINLVKGVQPMKVFFDGALNSFELNSITITLKGISCQDPAVNPSFVSGINYSYYEGSWDSLPNFDFLTPTKNGVVSAIDLTQASSEDNFGLLFDGFINAPSSGTYTFYTTSDEGTRLSINDIEVVDNDGIHLAQEVSGSVCLNAGLHAIKVAYFESSGSNSLSVMYEGPGISKREISNLYGHPTNLAIGGNATQSSTDYDGPAELAIDGNTDGDYNNGSVTHTGHNDPIKWWQVDIGSDKIIWDIKVFNRVGYSDRLNNFTVEVIDSNGEITFSQFYESPPNPSVAMNTGGVTGKIVKISKSSDLGLTLAEVEVYGGDLAIVKFDQTITFQALASKVIGDSDFSLTAASNAGLAISYNSSNTDVATVVDGNIQIVAEGLTVITASQSGNDNYNAAVDVSQTLIVMSTTSEEKQNQTITFSDLPVKIFGDADFASGASVSSELPIIYTSSNTDVATIVGSNIHIVGAGTSEITALQVGNETYNPISVSRTLTVNKQDQTITFSVLEKKEVGDEDFSPGATSSSGLEVSYRSSNTEVARIISGNIRVLDAGTTTITATQDGNNAFASAAEVTQELVIKYGQTITFETLPVKAVGDADFSPGATSSSELPITYTSSATDVAMIVDGNIHIVSSGISMITASQVGDGVYNAAADVTQTLAITPGTALSTVDNFEGISFHPNPVLDILQVDLENEVFDEYEIYNINGQVIGHGEIGKGMKELTIDFGSFSKGMYFLKLVGDLSFENLKVIKN